VVAGLGVQLERRVPFEVFASHNSASLYSTLADGRPANSYTLRVENRDRSAHRFELALEAPAGFDLLAGVNPIAIEPLGSRELRVFVAAPRGAGVSQAQEIWFSVADAEHAALRVRRRATFLTAATGEHEEHHGDDEH
jgi:hypothetical protein